jgi:hypothetical protein
LMNSKNQCSPPLTKGGLFFFFKIYQLNLKTFFAEF